MFREEFRYVINVALYKIGVFREGRGLSRETTAEFAREGQRLVRRRRERIAQAQCAASNRPSTGRIERSYRHRRPERNIHSVSESNRRFNERINACRRDRGLIAPSVPNRRDDERMDQSCQRDVNLNAPSECDDLRDHEGIDRWRRQMRTPSEYLGDDELTSRSMRYVYTTMYSNCMDTNLFLVVGKLRIGVNNLRIVNRFKLHVSRDEYLIQSSKTSRSRHLDHIIHVNKWYIEKNSRLFFRRAW